MTSCLISEAHLLGPQDRIPSCADCRKTKGGLNIKLYHFENLIIFKEYKFSKIQF